MKGTWQGSGTFQTGGGPDLSGLIPVAVLVGVAYAVAVFVMEFIWYIVGFLAAVLVGVVIGAVLLRRRRARAARPVAPLVVTAVRVADELPAARPGRPAIEPSRTRVSAYPRIDAQPNVVTRPVARPRCAHRGERRS